MAGIILALLILGAVMLIAGTVLYVTDHFRYFRYCGYSPIRPWMYTTLASLGAVMVYAAFVLPMFLAIISW